MTDKAFSEEQKQFLSGFAFGSDVARAVSNLPIISGSGSPTGTTLKVGGGASTIDGSVVASRPEMLALQAQADAEAAGKKLSIEEKAKREKNPLDMWDEIIARSNAGTFPKGTDVFLTKFHGLFHVAPAQDSFMCRMRIPGGVLHAWQFRGLADLSDRSAGGYIDVTTRANLQFREIPADQAAHILYGLRDVDVISLGSGGDNIRNCTASTLSGIDGTELVETIPLAKRMHNYILNHREMYGLPRKFNIAFDGGGKVSALDDTNDIGFHAVLVTPEHASEDLLAGVYFQLTLGGITGHKDFARPTGVLLTADECYEVAGGIVRVFVKTGDRTDRKKARLKYVLDDMGFDLFLEAVEKQIGRKLRRVDQSRLSVPHNEDRSAHVGFHLQKQPGLSYVGVVLPVGRITSDQARSLADIAQRYGNGEIRFTVWQNLIIPFIANEDINEVDEKIRAIGLNTQASSFRAGLVACTGSAGCKYAAADTKANAMAIAEALESQFELDQPINIHVTGCHHSCAQHYIGDIGLIGCKVERGDDMVDGYHIHLGGGWGDRQGIARLLFEYVVAEDCPQTIACIVGGYLERRQEGESFVQFASRSSDEELKSLLNVSV
ncbi:Sulfite reductase [ferredoxin] [Rubripirellula amarantea]|uniref:Sulfite reductase [ferredoxin] n=1 Tax=Rubripirellula amarantea TaxID=2527999 RepID=A0A5C5WSC7_9BACT|nr:NirA family protein [Rubripirellula amarantea]TWT53045.1 Sulfite reductase [ferredoxin] [Rubripirellula amarantea]